MMDAPIKEMIQLKNGNKIILTQKFQCFCVDSSNQRLWDYPEIVYNDDVVLGIQPVNENEFETYWSSGHLFRHSTHSGNVFDRIGKFVK